MKTIHEIENHEVPHCLRNLPNMQLLRIRMHELYRLLGIMIPLTAPIQKLKNDSDVTFTNLKWQCSIALWKFTKNFRNDRVSTLNRRIPFYMSLNHMSIHSLNSSYDKVVKFQKEINNNIEFTMQWRCKILIERRKSVAYMTPNLYL